VQTFCTDVSAYLHLHTIFYSTSTQDKFGGALNLNRETSKEIGDRLDARYPVPPADVNNTYLVENMVRSLLVCLAFSLVCFSVHVVDR